MYVTVDEMIKAILAVLSDPPTDEQRTSIYRDVFGKEREVPRNEQN